VFHVIQQLNAASIHVIRERLLTTLYDTISRRKMSGEEGDARTFNLPDTGGGEILNAVLGSALLMYN
jgi:hypothetical protein